MTLCRIAPLWIDGIIIGYGQSKDSHETYILNGFQMHARASVVLAWYSRKGDEVADKRLENRDIRENAQYDRDHIPGDN